MKILIAAALSFLVAAPAWAQARTGQPAESTSAPAVQPKIDPVKEADIRHLLDVTGTAALVQQVISGMEQNIKPLMASSLPAGEYRDPLIELFFQRFNSKLDSKRLMDLAVARYDQNFSDEEVKGLIAFYETPLGQKVATVLPKLSAQLQQDGQKLGQQLGRESMIEVLSEHPDLKQGLEAASRKTSADSQ